MTDLLRTFSLLLQCSPSNILIVTTVQFLKHFSYPPNLVFRVKCRLHRDSHHFIDQPPAGGHRRYGYNKIPPNADHSLKYRLHRDSHYGLKCRLHRDSHHFRYQVLVDGHVTSNGGWGIKICDKRVVYVTTISTFI